jgi:hypothetical protein
LSIRQQIEHDISIKTQPEYAPTMDADAKRRKFNGAAPLNYVAGLGRGYVSILC